MDRQLVLTEVRDHLVAQGRPSVSWDGDPRCLFRGSDGLRCAIGILIDDEVFDPAYTDGRVFEIPVMAMLQESGLGIDLVGDDLDFLGELQAAHDEPKPGDDWLPSVLQS